MSISAADANRQFSRVLRAVREGRSYVVTAHGRPVARITPIRGGDKVAADARKALLDWLRSQPVTEIGHWTRDELYDDLP